MVNLVINGMQVKTQASTTIIEVARKAGIETLRPFERAEINPVDAKELGIQEGNQIRVTSRRGSIVTRVQITERVSPGLLFMTFHYKESPVNELTNSAYDPITKTAEYKVSAVKIERFK